MAEYWYHGEAHYKIDANLRKTCRPLTIQHFVDLGVGVGEQRPFDLFHAGLRPRFAIGTAPFYGNRNGGIDVEGRGKLPVAGEIEDRPVAVDGRVEVQPVLPIGATADHRYVDGAHLGQALLAFRRYLEAPASFEPSFESVGASDGDSDSRRVMADA